MRKENDALFQYKGGFGKNQYTRKKQKEYIRHGEKESSKGFGRKMKMRTGAGCMAL